MPSSKISFKELTEPVELTEEDIKRIKYRKRKKKITWGLFAAFEVVVAFISGLTGLLIIPPRPQLYPYSAILLAGGIFSLSKTQKSHLLKFLMLTVMISVLSLLIGLILGSEAAKPPTTTLYGVYFNEK